MSNKKIADLTALEAAAADDDLFIIYDTSTGIVKSVTYAYLASGAVSDTAYAASWDGVTNIAPSKNAVRDEMEKKVSAAANIAANAIVVGDGGVKGVKAQAGTFCPDYNEADQGLTGNGKSAKAYIDAVGADSATLVFRHSSDGATTTYTFSTDETIPSNINVVIEKGAILDTDISIRNAAYKWTFSAKSQLVEDCEDAWNETANPTGVTNTADTADKKVGAASAKCAMTVDAAVGILATEAIASTDLSGYSYVRLWAKCSVATAAGDFQLLLDDTAACASPLKSLDIPALTADTWTEVTLALGDAAGLTAIISVGKKMVVDKGACDLRFDEIRAVHPYEYYLELAAGGNPGISKPSHCAENDSALTAGTLGTLATREWNWGDNDTLGYSTVYVRLSDSTDPDGKAADFVKAGYTLTINGPFEAGLYQVFNCTGTGKVLFGINTQTIEAVWWAENTIPGTTDMLAALNAAVASVGTWRGAVIPIRSYAVSDTLVLLNKTITLQGFGWGKQLSTSGSYLQWIGSAGNPMLQVENCQGLKVSDFRLIGDSTAKPSTGIYYLQSAGEGNNYNTFERLLIGSISWDAVDYDFQMDVGILFGGTVGNDSNKWDMIRINHCPIGIDMSASSQHLIQHFSNLFIWYASTAAIKTKANLSGNNWFFAMNEIDIWLSDVNSLPIIDVQSFNSESGGRMILFTGGGTVHVHSGYWQARNAWINADHKFIKAENGQQNNVILEDFALTNYSGYSEATPTVTMKSPAGGESRNVFKMTGRGAFSAANVDMQPLNQANNEAYIEIDNYGAGTTYVIHRWSNWLRYGAGIINLAVDDTRQDTFGNFKVNKGLIYTVQDLANDATPSIANGTIWRTGGTTTITDFDDGVLGQVIIINSMHAVTITHGTNIYLAGHINFVMAAGDTLTLMQEANGLWRETSRMVV